MFWGFSPFFLVRTLNLLFLRKTKVCSFISFYFVLFPSLGPALTALGLEKKKCENGGVGISIFNLFIYDRENARDIYFCFSFSLFRFLRWPLGVGKNNSSTLNTLVHEAFSLGLPRGPIAEIRNLSVPLKKKLQSSQFMVPNRPRRRRVSRANRQSTHIQTVWADFQIPGSANSSMGLLASAGSPTRAVSAASTVSAESAISVSVAGATMTTSPAGAKYGGSIQGAGSFVNPAATPAARGPCVREGEGKRLRVV